MLNEKIYVFDDIIDVNSQNDIVKLLIKDYVATLDINVI